MSIRTFLTYLIVCFSSALFGQKMQKTEVPKFFEQSFNVSHITPTLSNSLGANYVGDGRLMYVSDRPGITAPRGTKFRLWSMDLIDQKSKRVNTKNLCQVNDIKYNVAGVCVDDSNTFMMVAVNDASMNDFLAETRITLLHIDLSHGFSQCATPPFVKIGYTYTNPFYHDATEYLYFASNMPGGKGGLDIYRVKKLGPNTWGEVEPLDAINTPNNDVYPFISNEGDIYYSTLTSKSGYDVFIYDFGKKSLPTRLPAPVNSRVDDFNFLMISSKDAIVSRSSANSDYTIMYRMLAF